MDIEAAINTYIVDWYGWSTRVEIIRPVVTDDPRQFYESVLVLEGEVRNPSRQADSWATMDSPRVCAMIALFQFVVVNHKHVHDPSIPDIFRASLPKWVQSSERDIDVWVVDDVERARLAQIANILRRILDGCEGESK